MTKIPEKNLYLLLLLQNYDTSNQMRRKMMAKITSFLQQPWLPFLSLLVLLSQLPLLRML